MRDYLSLKSPSPLVKGEFGRNVPMLHTYVALYNTFVNVPVNGRCSFFLRNDDHHFGVFQKIQVGRARRIFLRLRWRRRGAAVRAGDLQGFHMRGFPRRAGSPRLFGGFGYPTIPCFSTTPSHVGDRTAVVLVEDFGGSRGRRTGGGHRRSAR